MSGIVGIFRRDGAPVDRSLLAGLTKFLSFRGPDAQQLWTEGCIGFGHTMLRTTREAAHERQPASIGSDFWITADVRLDCRADLIEKLAQAGCRFSASQITDPELILHAYEVWREACVDHLRGDFAFALWDARERKLFCARDHFGIKPFFYSVNEHKFLFSNTLNCLRAHPDISDELNEAAIGDFLLFGLNCDIARTTFRDIQRLSPAHFLVVTRDGLRMQRYWSPPVDGRIRYNRPEEYVDHFLEILKASVADRLRTDRVGIFLSGGLDSGAVAAMARELSVNGTGSGDLRAYTMYFKSRLRDEERVYAKLTAEHLQIPVQFLLANTNELFAWSDNVALSSPEPVENPFLSDVLNTFLRIGSDCRVMLSGEGADNLMDFQMWPYVKDLILRKEWGTFAENMAHFLWIRPFPWRGLAWQVQQLFGGIRLKAGIPDWINTDFAKRIALLERWKTIEIPKTAFHPLMPRAHASLTIPDWNNLLENADPGVTGTPLEVRYPFLDLRIVDYLLALPPFPWFFKKHLLRKAMASLLPGRILHRAKTPLRIDPIEDAFKYKPRMWEGNVQFCDEIKRYLNPSEFLPLHMRADVWKAHVIIRPLCLNFWLQSYKRLRYNLDSEVHNVKTG